MSASLRSAVAADPPTHTDLLQDVDHRPYIAGLWCSESLLDFPDSLAGQHCLAGTVQLRNFEL